ncbi:hypothetical protein CC78DRAFT_565178 [Lojkania enalia]|uniref:Uncharacterized protein n=1 Tax=Lojkania enalia TaxID=147567 RepID=A0A9P4N983_9PLEO|nr:hypothetical protein CC78DRAFT_565178 [Didymosphaeria enalia]
MTAGPQACQLGKIEGKLLTIKPVSAADEGKGVISTLSTIPLGSEPSDSNVNRTMNYRSSSSLANIAGFTYNAMLAAQLIATIGTQSPLNPSVLWGPWINLIPSRIGVNTALDDAVACFAAGNVAYNNSSQPNIAIARERYSRALRSLRNYLNGQEGRLASTETLAAVLLLIYFETLLEFRTNHWASHSRGLTSLLVTRGPPADADGISPSMFYSFLPYEFTEAVLTGTNSAFDFPEWLSSPLPEHVLDDPAHQKVCHAVIQQIVQIPRLICLVRRLQDDQSNIEVKNKTLSLAETLYNSNVDSLVDEMLQIHAESVETKTLDLSCCFPQSLKYGNIHVFETLTRYWYCRILIVGLCRTLQKLIPASKSISARLVEEDARAAGYIAMSTQYAESLSKPLPMGPLVIVLPLQFSFGAWWRLYREQHGVSKGLIEKAAYMKGWTLRKGNAMLGLWNGKELENRSLEVKTVAFEGGPLMGWMKRDIAPDGEGRI